MVRTRMDVIPATEARGTGTDSRTASAEAAVRVVVSWDG